MPNAGVRDLLTAGYAGQDPQKNTRSCDRVLLIEEISCDWLREDVEDRNALVADREGTVGG